MKNQTMNILNNTHQQAGHAKFFRPVEDRSEFYLFGILLQRAALFLLLCTFLSLYPQVSTAQGKISLSASVDRATITIGDLITYTVTVIHDKDVRVFMPSLGENLGGFEIRDYTDHEPREEDGKIIKQVDYIISTFDVGDFEIPPVEIGYMILPDSTRETLKTESIKIVVESVKPSEDGDIREIKPPWEIPYNWKPVIVGSIIALFAILFIIALIYVIRKRRRGEPILPKKIEPPRPPHEIAYEELKRLADSGFLQNGEIKQYYSEISDIIRQYIEGRYQIIAMELTTTEVLDQLKTTDVADEHFDLFVRFLEACDLVKFAKYVPGKKEHDEIMRLAVEIVDVTKWTDSVAGETSIAAGEEKASDSEILVETEENEESHPESVTEECSDNVKNKDEQA